ncbi:MAG: hypothetical protein ACE14V_05845 [bacterium]
MDKKTILWIRIMSGICVLIGLIYLGASIWVVILSIPHKVTRIIWATEALFILYAICFMIGGIGVAFQRYWGREMLIGIIWIDIVREILVIFSPILLNLINPDRVHSSNAGFGIIQGIMYFILLFELIMVWYLNRKPVKQLFMPTIPNKRSDE